VYYVPRVRTKLGERAFSYARPVVWNNLPLYIRAEPDIARFKNILNKTYFLDSHLIYYVSTEVSIVLLVSILAQLLDFIVFFILNFY